MEQNTPFSSQPMQNNQMEHKASENSLKKKLLNKRDMILVGLLALFVLVAGGLGYLYYRERQRAKNPTVVASEEARKLKEQVSKHILLPDGDPAIATIVDVEKLKQNNPEFYANAKNGQKLLVYKNKAILYDPDIDRIINVAPVLNTENSTTPTPTLTPTTTP